VAVQSKFHNFKLVYRYRYMYSKRCRIVRKGAPLTCFMGSSQPLA